jgi:folate-binding protein YgfZ
MPAYSLDLGQYAALRNGGGFVELTDWSSLVFTGADRLSFLHNFCTNDIRRLSPGQSCEAFVTNVKGKIVGHGIVSCRESELVLNTVPGQSAALVSREDVQVAVGTAARGYLLVDGAALARVGILAAAPDKSAGAEPRHLPGNAPATLLDIPVRWIRWELLQPTDCGLLELHPRDLSRAGQSLADKGISPCGWAAFHALRIESGTPLFGHDFDDRNLPPEVGRNEQAVSFTKGCYLGQETVARIDAVGHVNQQLAGVRFAAARVPEAGAELTHAGKTAGRVTSATFSPQLQAPLALAMLRRECASVGSVVETAGARGEVIALPVSSTRAA